MKFDSTVTFSMILAIVAFVSPIAVAIINNRHQAEIRKLEMEQELKIKIADTYYDDKKKAFECFANAAGNFITYSGAVDRVRRLENLFSASHSAMLYCSEDNKNLILLFITFVVSEVDKGNKFESKSDFTSRLLMITSELNAELSTLRNSNEKLYDNPKESKSKVRKNKK